MKKIFVILLGVLMIGLMGYNWQSSPVQTAEAQVTSLATGTVTGTAANINVSLGFTPRYVIVSNPSTTTVVKVEWSKGMAAASCTKFLDSATAGSIISKITVSCISEYAGSTTTAPGFRIGTDSDLNISGDTLHYRAWR